MTIEELLNKNIAVLGMCSPYAFNMLIQTFTSPNSKIETARVFTRNGHFYLEYNPAFMKRFKTPGRSFILCHECLHILLHHCSGYRSSSDPRDQLLENLAMDLAVNCLIPTDDKILLDYPRPIQEDGTLGAPEVFLPSDFKFDDYLSFEQYKELLEQHFKDKGELDIIRDLSAMMNGGNIMLDDHSMFSEDSTAEAKIRSLFTDHLERNRMFGKMSAPALNSIRAAQTRQVPWHRLVRTALGKLVTWDKTPTRRKFHKYYGAPFPGWDYKCIDPIACYLDLSGSMSEHQKSMLAGELSRLTDVAPVYLWGFDSVINNPDIRRTFRRSDFMRPIQIEGGGGTAFTPIFEHAISKGFRYVVVLTDGEAEEVTIPLPRTMQVLWVINNRSNHEYITKQPGKMIFMK